MLISFILLNPTSILSSQGECLHPPHSFTIASATLQWVAAALHSHRADKMGLNQNTHSSRPVGL